jgi:glutamine amidotransferase
LKKKPNIGIIDTGTSNLRSVDYALKEYNVNVLHISSYEDFSNNIDGIIVPGIGSYPVVMKKMRDKGLAEIVLNQISTNKPSMFICVGMQILFSKSHEFGETKGLDIFKGEVKKIVTYPKKIVPVIGWNKVLLKKKCPLLNDNSNFCYYFTHSYFVKTEEENIISTTAKYGSLEYCSSISHKNIFAFQFHPEKSGKDGLKIYKNFINLI